MQLPTLVCFLWLGASVEGEKLTSPLFALTFIDEPGVDNLYQLALLQYYTLM